MTRREFWDFLWEVKWALFLLVALFAFIAWSAHRQDAQCRKAGGVPMHSICFNPATVIEAQ